MSPPKVSTPVTPPPPPTPAMLQPPKSPASIPTLGNTYLTSGTSMAAPRTKGQKTLLGQ